ncbi:FHA domain-containing protein [Ferribacterium limneticum]|uniref:FHA domain-containing protein n=1 Tax=Ferribacterium limneticum TaxID=76259 RepID=UPI001CFB1E95|nr:FHA domain-containing protein [Ferribacterium limneticum]UCV28787.1 FHA domain-containing protein [Ferribacterium limneticum]UCV32704.1 FHA domain-containing protein [Ferribacterium limneticum]
MQNQTTPSNKPKSFARQAPGAAYLVHGAVHEISGQASELDASLLGKLFRRRLKRLERVLAAHGGALIRQMPQSLLASFETAEAALLGACEMQRRCAVIPQIADTQIALKIGIHLSVTRRISTGPVDPAEATASKLSSLLDEASIVISESVAEALPVSLREKTVAVVNEGSEIPAYAVDWNSLPMLRAAPPKSSAEADPDTPHNGIIIRQGERVLRFTTDRSLLTIGRDPASDIAINCPKASRQHCRIIYRLGNYVLVDLSTNGTYVTTTDAPEILIRKEMATLTGNGRIGFGQSWHQGGDHAFEFEVSVIEP